MAQAQKAPPLPLPLHSTGSSWPNQVERWFGLITDMMTRRGTFYSVKALERAICAWLASWNDTPQGLRLEGYR